jgi:KaiC/GvpD/RAD55 family RecA-like ATPase
MSQTPVSEGKIKVSVTKVPLLDRILLLGAPGIGKTEIIRQKAKEEARRLEKIFVDLREVNEELLEQIFEYPDKFYIYLRVVAPHIFPEDLGIPKMVNHASNKDYVEYVPPKVLKVLSLPEIHGVLFIDEITNVQRDDQISMYYSLILEKEAGFQLKLSRNVKIVLAGNTPEWSTIVRELPAPLINRMKIFEVTPPTVDEWIDYMQRTYNDRWEKACAVYLKMFPAELLIPPKQAFEAFPTPRSWTLTCLDIYELRRSETDEDVIEAAIVGGLGHEVGLKFSRIFKVGTDLDKVLGEIATRPEVFEEIGIETKILVLSSIASQTYENITKYRKFMEYLLEKHRELLTVLVTTMNKDTKARLLKEQWFNDGIIRRLASEIGPYVKPRKK